MEKIRLITFYRRELERVNRFDILRTAEENQSILTQTIKLKQKLIEEGFDNIGVINSANGAYLFFRLQV